MHNDEQKNVQKKLNEELSNFTFTGAEKVIKRTHPKSMSDKFKSWWNKEVTVPLAPVGIAILLLISATVAPSFLQNNNIELPAREIIQVGGSFYWSDLFEEVRNK